LLSPYLPLLFMGEEYGETAPFLYFISHSDPALVEAVREGRKKEFASFDGTGTAPDPLAEGSFQASILSMDLRHTAPHRGLFLLYRRLISLRKTVPALSRGGKAEMEVDCREKEKALMVRRWHNGDEVFCVFNFGDAVLNMRLSPPEGRWRRLLDSSEEAWDGKGALSPEAVGPGMSEIPFTLGAHSFSLYRIYGDRD
jgi:maltooligosyltrehalose trehalohydrolase